LNLLGVGEESGRKKVLPEFEVTRDSALTNSIAAGIMNLDVNNPFSGSLLLATRRHLLILSGGWPCAYHFVSHGSNDDQAPEADGT
jgi:hypothetical protein